MPTSHLIPAVFYGRKSNEDGGDSIEQQLAWAREACPREGLSVEAEFTDQAKKGWETAKRTGFHEMLRFCQQRQREGRPVEAVVCWHANRFSRADSQETAWFVWEFRKAGVGRMFTATRWVDFARMEDRVLFNIEQDTSNHPYVINMARDATRGRIAAALDGRPNGGARPYGYCVEYETVVVRGKRRRRPLRYVLGPPEEGDVVRWLFRTYAAGRTTLRRLAIDLNARGVASPKGAPRWGQGTIKKLLNNPVYLGQAVWNRRHEGKFFGVVDCKVEPSKKRQGTVLNPEGEWIRREGRHEPLIDRETWEAVQRRLVENRKKPRPGRNGVFALAGLLVCGHCGRTMIGRTTVRKKRGRTYTYRRYTCGGYNTYGKSICSYNPIDEDRLLAVVIGKLRQAFLAPEALATLREEIRRQAQAAAGEGPGGAESLRKRLADLEGQLGRGTRRMLAEEDEGLVPGLRAEVLKMQGERDRLRGELEALERAKRPEEDLEELIAEAEAQLQHLQEALGVDDVPAVQAVVREMVSHVELWFDREQVGKETRCRFARGVIFTRPQINTSLSTVPNRGRSSRSGGPTRG